MYIIAKYNNENGELMRSIDTIENLTYNYIFVFYWKYVQHPDPAGWRVNEMK